MGIERYTRALRKWIAVVLDGVVSLPELLNRLGYWLFGIGFRHHDGGGHHAIDALMAMETAFLTAAAGLVLYIQADAEPRFNIWVAYVMVSFVPLLIMFGIMRIRTDANTQDHAFDRSTIMMARLCLSVSLVLLIAISFAYANEQLPGQKTTQAALPIVGAEESAFQESRENKGVRKGDPKIVVFFTVTADVFRTKQIPARMVIDIKLADQLKGAWRITGVQGFAGGADSTSLTDPSPRMDDDPDYPPHQKRVYWNFLDSQKRYTLRVTLQQQRETIGPTELKNRITENLNGPVVAVAYYKDQDSP
jgi:hypothetical protein